MAELTTKARKKIPKEQFGLPATRQYPMPDRAHAANAKARASQQVKAGNLTPAQQKTINAKANKVLGTTAKKTTKKK